MKLLVVELVGPDFFKEARTVARNLKLHAVGELRIQLGHTSPESPNVKAAVKSLKHHLLPNAAVLFITTPSGNAVPSTPSGQTAPVPSGGSVQKPQKPQTKTFEVTQDINANRAKGPANKDLEAYIRG